MRAPIGLLFSVAAPALLTGMALLPAKPTLISGRLRWASTMVINEQPLLVVIWLLLVVAPALDDHDIRGPLGWAAAVVAALTVGGLSVIAARGWRTHRTVAAALTGSLGIGWESTIPLARRQRLKERPSNLRIVVAPFLLRRRNIRCIRNQPYGDDGVSNLLDMYMRRGTGATGPILVYLHGGGFRRGRKSREARALLSRLAAHGWLCLSANYHLGPPDGEPSALIDVKRVLAWARQNAAGYGADPATIVVAGSSAGAQLAAMAALTANHPHFQRGFETSDTSVNAAVCLYGYYGSIGGWEPASAPQQYIHEQAPPIFVAHGDHDTLVPVEAAQDFVRQLRRVSHQPVVYIELAGAQHNFDLFHSLRFDALIDGIEAFAECSFAHR